MRVAAEVILLGLTAILLCSAGIYLVLKNRRQPWEKERKRRDLVNRTGRMGDAFITEVRNDTVYYNYEVRGVAYAASQDVSRLQDVLPENFETIIGHVGMKYLTRNPANSIVICETWSGLRLYLSNSNGETEILRKTE